MTFLSLLLRDTGTIFRIPKRMTFLWFTRTPVRTQLEISRPVDCDFSFFSFKAESILTAAVEQLTEAMTMPPSLVSQEFVISQCPCCDRAAMTKGTQNSPMAKISLFSRAFFKSPSAASLNQTPSAAAYRRPFQKNNSPQKKRKNLLSFQPGTGGDFASELDSKLNVFRVYPCKAAYLKFHIHTNLLPQARYTLLLAGKQWDNSFPAGKFSVAYFRV